MIQITDLLNLLTPYRKAIVPILVGGALTVLGYAGITAQMTVEEVLTLGITALLVYLIPNKKS